MGDSGHPRPRRGHENNECIYASLIRPKGVEGKCIGTTVPWRRHDWQLRSLPLRHSRAPNTTRREVRALTVNSTAMIAASGRGSEGWVDGGGGWREKEGAGEDESRQLKIKSRKSRYLRHRWVTVELRDTSVTGIALGNEGFAAGGGKLKRGRRKERGRGSGSGFIEGMRRCRW